MIPAVDGDVSPHTTLAVILGAHKWPNYSELDNDNYEASALQFKEYLEGDDGLGLPHLPAEQSHVLWLFNTLLDPKGIRNEIGRFISTQRAKCNPAVRDILFYYVGHGGIIGQSEEFYLAIPETHPHYLQETTLMVSALAASFSREAQGLRWFLILDCCFAGKAGPYFEKTTGSSGVAILCACLGNFLGQNEDGQGRTLLSGTLLTVLRQGIPTIERPLSFRNIEEGIKTLIPQGASQPVVQSAHPRVDIATVPVFPNPATNLRRIQRELIQLKREVATRFVEFSRQLEGLVQTSMLTAELESIRDAIRQARGSHEPETGFESEPKVGSAQNGQDQSVTPWWRSRPVLWLSALVVGAVLIIWALSPSQK